MSKPLSETHPTLYKESFFFRECISKDNYKDIQSCTVDVAEHDLIKTAYDAEQEARLELEDEIKSVRTFNEQLVKKLKEKDAEVERLKAEHETLKQKLQDLMDSHTYAEVERLKKELEELEIVSKYNALEAERLKKYLEVPRLSYWYDEGKKFGLVEGERRTKEQVKVFVVQARHNSVELFGRTKPEWCEGVEDTLKELERTLGLGEESTDNNNYTNKGEKQ